MKKVYHYLSILFAVLTIVGAAHVWFTGGKANAGYAVIPMVFTLIFSEDYRKKNEFSNSRNIRRQAGMKKRERFEKVYSQGKICVNQIWVDKETGVNYYFHSDGYAGGLTVLLDRDGKPVISRVSDSNYSD